MKGGANCPLSAGRRAAKEEEEGGVCLDLIIGPGTHAVWLCVVTNVGIKHKTGRRHHELAGSPQIASRCSVLHH